MQMQSVIIKFELDFRPGYNPKLKPCRLTVDELSFIHRPIVGYLGIFAFQLIGIAVLYLFGFRR